MLPPPLFPVSLPPTDIGEEQQGWRKGAALLSALWVNCQDQWKLNYKHRFEEGNNLALCVNREKIKPFSEQLNFCHFLRPHNSCLASPQPERKRGAKFICNFCSEEPLKTQQ